MGCDAAVSAIAADRHRHHARAVGVVDGAGDRRRSLDREWPRVWPGATEGPADWLGRADSGDAAVAAAVRDLLRTCHGCTATGLSCRAHRPGFELRCLRE